MFSVAGRRMRWAALLTLVGLLALGTVITFLASGPAWTGRLTVGAPDFWVEDIRRAVDLSDEEATRVLAAVRRALAAAESVPVDRSSLPAGPASPQVVLLSASDGRSRAKVAVGAGANFPAAVEHAVTALRRLGVTAKGARWLRLDVVKGAGERPLDGNGRPLPRPLPWDGVAFARRTGLAMLTPELAAQRALTSDGQVHVAHLPRLLQLRVAPPWRVALAEVSESERAALDEWTVTTPFASASFFSDGEGAERLTGTQRARSSTEPAVLLQAIRDGAAYLQRMTLADGRFVYSYLPGSDGEVPDYNIVRHAGTVYAMLEVYELTRDPALLADADRALGYLLGHIRPHPSTPAMEVVVSEGSVKLGGVALTLLALAKHAVVTGDGRYLPRMRALARYIQDSQGPDGAFVSQRSYPAMEPDLKVDVQYFPGESIFALLRLHALDPQESWLATAERGARYLIHVRDGSLPPERVTPDHWLLYALNELHRARPDPVYLDHAQRIARVIAASQSRSPYPPERVGIYGRGAHSTLAAARTEGLVAAYLLARDFGRREDLSLVRSAVELGVGFQLKTQLLPEQAMYAENPPRALGAFHQSLTDYEVRIDYVQHNLSGILGLRGVLLEASD